MGKVLMKGNEAIGEAAIRAGCRCFFGYPITPQTELPEYLSRHLVAAGGIFLQAESEVAAINMVFGAASTGARVMTSSSGPGISLKQEGISFLAGAELPCLIVNIMRGGPGLGNILPTQSDYYQATRGGGHGDYRTVVLAPHSVQEAAQLTTKGFDLAERYRTPVILLADGYLGQMMEPVEFDGPRMKEEESKPWAVRGKHGAEKRIVTSLFLEPEKLEEHNHKLMAKYCEISRKETMCETCFTHDAEIIVVAYGIVSRMAKAAVDMARLEGIRAGLFRPITLWPFPARELSTAAAKAVRILVVEMSMGQMVEDVEVAVGCRLPVEFYGRTGGMAPTVRAIYERIKIKEMSSTLKREGV